MFVPIGANSGSDYQTQRSLRLRASASASASRTPVLAGNRKLLARRFRIKIGTLGTKRVIASAGTASIDSFYIDSSDRLCLDVLGTARLVTTPVRRDPTAWYVDVGFELDVANGTAGARAKILIDGTEVSYTTDGRASITNTDTNWNNTVIHYLGRDNAGNYFDGNMAEVLGVDGSTAIASYSSVDLISSQRVAALPLATYGTTGYLVDFSNVTSLTTMGYDRSGNSNHWTLANISLTAGSTYDSMLDVPLGGGGNERGNYCTLNPLTAGGRSSVQEANLSVSHLTTPCLLKASIGVSAGKWRASYRVGSIAGNWPHIGITDQARAPSDSFGAGAADYTYYGFNGNKWNNNVSTAYGAVFGAGDDIDVEFDADAGTLTYFKNGVSQGVAFTGIPAGTYFFTTGMVAGSCTIRANFGQRPFTYTPPTGFKALHTDNLTNVTPIASGSFTGNLSADGPCIWCNGTPETLTINGNAVTWGTHADKLATGFKIRTASSSYNSSGTNTWTATYLSPSSKSAFKYQNAKGN